ncbi:hypothetical protein D3C80_1810390 [compost metagenome]
MNTVPLITTSRPNRAVVTASIRAANASKALAIDFHFNDGATRGGSFPGNAGGHGIRRRQLDFAVRDIYFCACGNGIYGDFWQQEYPFSHAFTGFIRGNIHQRDSHQGTQYHGIAAYDCS